MSDYKREINQIKEKLDQANTLKVRSETKLENLEEEREKLLTEIKNEGIEPDQLEEEIEELESELQELIKEAKELLPEDNILDGSLN
ncbi:MAG: hypothetical protein ACQEP9_03240 [Bacillota bacterium]